MKVSPLSLLLLCCSIGTIDARIGNDASVKSDKDGNDGRSRVINARRETFPRYLEEAKIITSKTEYTSGEAIDGTFVNPEPDSYAWIAIYPASSDPLALPFSSAMWNWYNDLSSGSFLFNSTSDHGEDSWPLLDGEWQLFLFRINSDNIPPYESLAYSNIFIVSGGDCIEPCESSKPSFTSPIHFPSGYPSSLPSSLPLNLPSTKPSSSPSGMPSTLPSSTPSDVGTLGFPSNFPRRSKMPSYLPSSEPTIYTRDKPTATVPTVALSLSPSSSPSALPSSTTWSVPSSVPSSKPSALPSLTPTVVPSSTPSSEPSASPSSDPSSVPSTSPSSMLSAMPSSAPSSQPSALPSLTPSAGPSPTPTLTARTHPLDRKKFVARVLSKAWLRAEPNAAKCLDGSPAVYYIKLGTAGAGGTDKLMVHFGGGAWCINKLDCWHRATHSSLYGDYIGGMQAYVNPYIKSDTYFSDSQAENPEFYSHTKVFVRYCDGGSFAGHKPFDPNFPLYFRGKLIVDAVFEDLFDLDERFKEAKDVVITGESAGGMAVFLNIDRIKKKYFPESVVMGIPNAGYFPGTQGINAQGIHWSYEMLITAELHGITHPGGSLEGSKCLSNKAVPAWCIFPSLIVQYIETPMFIVNSVFDSYVSQYALGIPVACGVAGACYPPSGVHAIHQMHALRHNILSSLAIAPTVVSGRSAYFTHACPTHGEQLNSPGRWKKLQNPADRQWTLYKTLNLWHRSLVAGKITMVPNSIGGGLWGNKYDIHAIWPNYRDESCY